MGAFEPVLKRWMNLEPTTQSEISQKEKNKYCAFTHIYGIWKDGTDETMCMQTWRAGLWTQVGRRRWGARREEHGNTHITTRKTESPWEFAVWSRELSPVLCDNLEGWERVGCGKEVQEGVDICIPVADSSWCMAEKKHYYKAVILQLELKNKQKMVEMVGFMVFIFATMRERC